MKTWYNNHNMIKQELNNYAYIDGANLHNDIASFG